MLLPCFVYWRKFVHVAALVAVAGLNASFLVPWYLSGEHPSAAGAGGKVPLKIVHANVHSSNTQYDRLVDFIDDEDPDFILLQEVNADWVAGTAGLRVNYPYAYTEPRDGNFGIAAFSKSPLDSISHIDSPPLGYPTIIAKLTVHDEPLTIISTHPNIPVGRYSYTSRNEQLESITALVNRTSGKVILTGDFNASIWDSNFLRLQNETQLKNVRQGFGVLPTWPTFMPFAMIPIDHMLVSREIDVLDAEVGRRIGSDHLPLVVTLSL